MVVESSGSIARVRFTCSFDVCLPLQKMTCLASSKHLACAGTADGTFLIWDLLQVRHTNDVELCFIRISMLLCCLLLKCVWHCELYKCMVYWQANCACSARCCSPSCIFMCGHVLIVRHVLPAGTLFAEISDRFEIAHRVCGNAA